LAARNRRHCHLRSASHPRPRKLPLGRAGRSLRPVTIEVGGALTLDDVLAAARGEPVALAPQARERMLAARRVVGDLVAANGVVYRGTTRLGALAHVHLSPRQAHPLQHSLLRTHAVGVGEPLSEWEVRAMLVLRAHVLALGHSGVRPVVVERLLQFLERSVLPVVPEQGSLGASGDLAPLAHLALPLIGEGDGAFEGQRMPAADALKRIGVEPLELEAKEGLALINGTQAMLSVGILALERSLALARAADVAAAMT